MVIALFCIITLTFFLMRIAPGNPFASEKALLANIRPAQQQYGRTHGISSHHDYSGKYPQVRLSVIPLKYRRSTNDIWPF